MSDNHHPGDPSVVGDELNGENHETTSETPYTSYQHLHQESNQAQEESEQQTVENGGFYSADFCNKENVANISSVAIIVPYRDRYENFQRFICYIHAFLMRQKIEYKIYVVSQVKEIKICLKIGN